jgi:hypothetical protein
MNVVGDSIDDQRSRAHFANDSAKIGVQIGPDFRIDQRQPLFGRKNQMDNNVAAGLGQVSFALSGLCAMRN